MISLLRHYYGSLVLGFTTPTPKESTKLIPLPEANTGCQKKKKKIWLWGKMQTPFPWYIHTQTFFFWGGGSCFKRIPFIARSQACKTHAVLEWNIITAAGMVKKVQEIRLAPSFRRPRHIYMVKITKNKTKQIEHKWQDSCKEDTQHGFAAGTCLASCSCFPNASSSIVYLFQTHL